MGQAGELTVLECYISGTKHERILDLYGQKVEIPVLCLDGIFTLKEEHINSTDGFSQWTVSLYS